MAKLPKFHSKELQAFSDSLHEALTALEDIRWDPWVLRCIEFHLGQGHYNPGEFFGWHMHKEVQFEIPLQGEFQFAANQGKPMIVKRGDVYVVPPETVHRWKCTRPALMLGISLAVVPRATSLATPLQSWLKPSVIRPVALAQLLDSLLAERRLSLNPPTLALKRLVCWMHLLITQILGTGFPKPVYSSGQEPGREPSSRSQRVVGKIIRFIDANIDGDLSMERFEQAVGLSTRQIHRLFIEVTGRSCHRYVMERRLEIARSMIQADPAISIKEVSYATGFVSPAHFSSTFKKVFGVSPRNLQ